MTHIVLLGKFDPSLSKKYCLNWVVTLNMSSKVRSRDSLTLITFSRILSKFPSRTLFFNCNIFSKFQSETTLVDLYCPIRKVWTDISCKPQFCWFVLFLIPFSNFFFSLLLLLPYVLVWCYLRHSNHHLSYKYFFRTQ